jgi:hypothetical protein
MSDKIWKPTPHPLRLVVKRRDVTTKYCRPGEGSRWHILECGHEIITKQSAGIPLKKRCPECARALVGTSTPKP